MGLLPASEGERGLLGQIAGDVEIEQRARVAFVAHTTQLYTRLTARENMQLFVQLRQAAGAATSPIEPLLARLGLADAMDRIVGTFSRGMMQRLSLARALVGRPSLLLLDEPFTSLDPPGRDRLRDVLREEAARGLGVLLSSHDYDAILAVTDRVVLLAGGRLVGQACRGEVADEYRHAVLGLGRAPDRPRAEHV
jgi:ABC-type multidrug transport system ATPase subunit